MLPQFGYIVAQAGADSRPPSQGLYGRSHSRSPPPPSTQPSQQQQQPQQSQAIHNGSTKETKSYYSAPPRSPSQDSPSMHPNVAGAPSSRSTMLPTSIPTSSSAHLQQQQQQQQPIAAATTTTTAAAAPPPYMYSTATTSVPPPHIASSHGGQLDYGAHYYANYDRGTGIDSHPQATAGTGASFRPLQQAPPRPTSTYPWQPHDPYMDHSYRVPPGSSSSTSAPALPAPAPPTSSVWHMPPPPPSTATPYTMPPPPPSLSHSHSHPPPPPPPTSSIAAPPPPMSPSGNQSKSTTTTYTSMNNSNVYQQQQNRQGTLPLAKSSTITHDTHLSLSTSTTIPPLTSSADHHHHHHYAMAPPLPPSTHDIMTTTSTKDIPMYGSSVHMKQTPPPPPTSRWHQDDTSSLNEPKMFRRLREYNELMTWMDNEFWEQNDEVYQEKLQSLQKELKSIQEGDHAAFQELVTDLEIIRDQTIESALCFENYQMTMTKQDLDLDVMLIEEEFKNDSQHLNEVIMLVIDEYRKQIKDDRDDTDELDTQSIFREAYTRIQQKRNLRKRTTPSINTNGDRPSPSRQETSSRGRRLKNTTVPPHNINAALTAKEEDDVESEYMAMKGVLPKRNAGTSRR